MVRDGQVDLRVKGRLVDALGAARLDYMHRLEIRPRDDSRGRALVIPRNR